ncbi:MAG TPA: hypothetical protein VK348_15420 [Planctomycetota bacterium]|nr:hypothetical protein [Planctomycetota bacterium]
MARMLFTLSLLTLAGGCTLPRSIDALQAESPPPEFGRPAWVRTCAGVGAWVGGILGGVVSVVLLPVTYPISLAAGDSFGDWSRSEFLFFPAVGGAASGHFLFGAPPDAVDFLCRRAWVGEPLPVNTYELVPMQPPVTAAKPAAEGVPPEGR